MSAVKCLAAASICAASLPALAAGQTKLKTLYSFANSPDAAAPVGSLLYLDGLLYGVTDRGGANGAGTVFAFDLVTHKETVLYSFGRAGDGVYPSGSLIYQGGQIYGTTQSGGASKSGTLFAIDPTTGAESMLYSFPGKAGGDIPAAGLTYLNGSFYGTTFAGGSYASCEFGCGTVFRYDPSTGSATVVFSFGSGGGAAPEGNLVYQDGKLYGTTTAGGPSGNGNVFALNVSTGAVTTIFNFTGAATGSVPRAGLIYEHDAFYGTTTQGGAASLGTVFKLDVKTGVETVLHSFAGDKDGSTPFFGNLAFHKGSLFGTTQAGGDYGYGTAFRVDATSGKESILTSFTGPGGEEPYSGVIYQDRSLYGTTSGGGFSNAGTVFKLKP